MFLYWPVVVIGVNGNATLCRYLHYILGIALCLMLSKSSFETNKGLLVTFLLRNETYEGHETSWRESVIIDCRSSNVMSVGDFRYGQHCRW